MASRAKLPMSENCSELVEINILGRLSRSDNQLILLKGFLQLSQNSLSEKEQPQITSGRADFLDAANKTQLHFSGLSNPRNLWMIFLGFYTV